MYAYMCDLICQWCCRFSSSNASSWSWNLLSTRQRADYVSLVQQVIERTGRAWCSSAIFGTLSDLQLLSQLDILDTQPLGSSLSTLWALQGLPCESEYIWETGTFWLPTFSAQPAFEHIDPSIPLARLQTGLETSQPTVLNRGTTCANIAQNTAHYPSKRSQFDNV